MVTAGPPPHPPAASPEPAPRNGWLRRHWRGELPLWQSFWVALVGVELAVSGLTAILDGAPYFQHHLLLKMRLVIGLLFFSLAVFPWQVVGCWRSAGRYLRGGGARWIGHTVRLLVAGSAAFTALLLALTVSALPELGRIALGIDAFARYQVRVLPGGEELEVAGLIGFGLTDDVERVLADHPGVRTVRLNSVGGRVAEARNLRELIARRGFATRTTGRCYSACAFVYMAGRERLLAPGARLGFHQPALPGVSDLLFQNEADKERRRLIEAGVAPAFAERALATPSDRMWVPRPAELLAAGVVHRIEPPPEGG